MKYQNDIPINVAMRAHSGTSMVPERRAEQERSSYSSGLESDYANLSRFAKTDEKKEILETEFARYRAGYRKRYIAWLESRSRCMSTMITGRSNFPVARQRKANGSADKRLSDVVEFRERALKAIKKTLTPELQPIMSGDADAVSRLTAKIAKLEETQSKFKEINKLIRKHKKKGPDAQVAALVEWGLSEDAAQKVVAPDFAGRVGIPSYELTNNNANIRRMKKRLASLSVAKEKADEEIEGSAARFEDSPADNRVRLFFPDKPDADVRKRLKSSGFRWAPSKGCWQAYRNHHAISVAKREGGL